MHIVLAITGASGVIYGVRLGEKLLAAGHNITILITRAGFEVLRAEFGQEWLGDEESVAALLRGYYGVAADRLRYHAIDNLLASVASGSSRPDAMVVCPCSMGSLGRIAHGISGNLLERCADVMLKERGALVLVPRETPLSEIHLENMLKMARLGARIVPAMPAFYHDPGSLDDMIDFVIGKVLDALGIENTLYRRWGVGQSP